MSKFLVIVDCQKDFIHGDLGTPEAQAMIPRLIKKIKNESDDTRFIFTADTYRDDYIETFEDISLPTSHCIKNTEGWELDSSLMEIFNEPPFVIEKSSFGSEDLIEVLDIMIDEGDEIEFVGVCTDICVISCALMAKTHFHNTAIISCDATCCAGVTPEKHAAALEVMKSCRIIVKEDPLKLD